MDTAIPVLSSQETDKIYKIAKIMANRIVGRYYPELLEDATSAAAIRIWQAREKNLSIPTQAWAGKMGALEVLRDRIGKGGKKANIYHTDSLDGQYNSGELRDMDTRKEIGAVDPQINAMLEYGMDQEMMILLTQWVTDDRRRQVLHFYYQPNPKTFREIGLVLGVSESRVYQFHLEAMQELRRTLMPILKGFDNWEDFFDYLTSCHRCFRCNDIQHVDRFPKGPNALCQGCRKRRNIHRNETQKARRNKGKIKPRLKKQQHVCRICERTMSVSLFSTKRAHTSGLSSYCQECDSCVRRIDHNQDPTSFSRRIPFLRACWRIAWQLGMVEGERAPIKPGMHIKVSSLDLVHQFPEVRKHLKGVFKYIPADFIDLWLDTPPGEANPKAWSKDLNRASDTIRRWRQRLYSEGQNYAERIAVSGANQAS